MEAEHDFKLSKDEWKQIKGFFDMVDADGSGEVDEAEFSAAVAAHEGSGSGLAQLKKAMKTSLAQGPSWEEVLNELDADMNGKVSWKELKGWFQQMEKEHDFKISKEDWDQIKGFFDMIDTDGSGEVDEAEFHAAVEKYGLNQKAKKMMAQVSTKQGPPSWDDILAEMDDDMNGQVSWPELKSFLERMEDEHDFQLSDDDWKMIKQFFDHIDTDGSGEVSETEFHAAMEAYGLAQKATRVMKKVYAKKHWAPK